jgi:hypothetical protein
MANLAAAFLLELCMLGAFAFWGFRTGEGLLMQLVLGIGVPALAVVLWGVFLAPKSGRRLTGSAYLALKALLFGLAALALAAAGQTALALIFAAAAAINQALLLAWGEGA